MTQIQGQAPSDLFDPSTLPPEMLTHLSRTVTPLHFLVSSAADLGETLTAPFHLRYLNDRVFDAITDRTQQRFIIVEASVRHAKSTLCTHAVPTWHMGMYPEDATLIVSYSDDFSEYWGRMNMELFKRVGPTYFGQTVDPKVAAVAEWRVAGHKGIMRAVGALGPITGLGFGLIVVDDPIKNNLEALSAVHRERLKNWFMTTIRTRLAPWGTLILVMARWHEADLAGWIQERMAEAGYAGDQWEVIHLPAIAEAPEHADPDMWRDELGRSEGDALWPAMWSKAQLMQIKASLDDATWSALYQQSPTSREGTMFRPENWVLIDQIDEAPLRKLRWWDLAATEGGGDYTVGALIGVDHQNMPVVLDIKRVRMRASDVEDLVLATAREDGIAVPIRMEQERAGAGNTVIEHYARVLMGFDFAGKRPVGDVNIRAQAWASAQQKRMVRMLKRDWTEACIHEHQVFSERARFDDQVDGCSSAFNELMGGGESAITPAERMAEILNPRARGFPKW